MRRTIATACLALQCACGSADTGTSPSAVETATLTTEMFTGTLSAGGLRFYSFTLPEDGAFTVLLASLSAPSGTPLPDLEVGLGVGTPAGTGCAVRESVTATPALVAQFRSWAADGIHCVAIYDVGHLNGQVSFSVRLTHN